MNLKPPIDLASRTNGKPPLDVVKPGVMRPELVEMTRDLARQLLSNNVSNRTLRRTLWEKYAGAMKRGEWQPVEFIYVAPDGRLLNGQHRLQGFLESGLPFDETLPMWICWNTPPEYYTLIDAGKPKSIADLLGRDRRITSVVGFISSLEIPGGRLTAELYEKYHRIFGRRTEQLLKICSSKEKSLGSAPVRAAVILRTFAGEDCEWAFWSFRALCNREYMELNGTQQVFVRQVDEEKLKHDRNSLFARAWKAFDSSQADLRTLKIGIIGNILNEARDVLRSAMNKGA